MTDTFDKLPLMLSPATGTAARTSWGILGILVVILTGLAVLLPVKPAQDLRTPAPEAVADTTV